MTQMMRAILLASATAASFFDLRASNASSHGEVRPGLAARITAVAPMTSNRRKSSSPAQLILPSFCRPAVEFSRGVMPIQEAKCRPERKARGSATLRAKLTPAIGPIPRDGRQALAGLILPMPIHQSLLDCLQFGVEPVELTGQHADHLAC